MPGLANELRVLGIGHWTGPDAEFVEIRFVQRPFVFLAVVGAHGEFAGRNPSDLQHRVVSHFSAVASVYRPHHRRMYPTLMAHNPVGIEISDMRKRLRAAIDQSRRAAAARRTELNNAAEAYERFLAELAEPLVQMLANALRAEGYPFTVFTPRGGLHLASGRSGEDFIEFALD